MTDEGMRLLPCPFCETAELEITIDRMVFHKEMTFACPIDSIGIHLSKWNLRANPSITPTASVVEEGMVLVPKEPTDAMWLAFFSVNSEQDDQIHEIFKWHGDYGNFLASYRAMLSAAEEKK